MSLIRFDPAVEECVQVLLDMRRDAEASADPAAWERLAAWYEYFGLEANAAACRRRAEHYREVEHVADREPSVVVTPTPVL